MPPSKVETSEYFAAVYSAAMLVQRGTDLQDMVAALERVRAVEGHPSLIAALEERIRRASVIKLMMLPPPEPDARTRKQRP